ncbi:hypothetical protein MPDQ_007743 [Monascus purpureus]|uniref:Uncharacterized protein n=1 Tax=Monascus purpureus TaxID=5098 RepID=A0A507QRG9_MONPU|nr:hypothetical protein MPDQ_007743 [Monascus purpureus]BDD57013.1 hypothetical protein MAP00_002420 [Monascus purpureus]
MLATRVKRPVTNTVTYPFRVASVRPPVPQWRCYSSKGSRQSLKQRPSSSHWLRKSIGLAGTAGAAFVTYTFATNYSKQAATPTEPKAKSINTISIEDLGSQYVVEKRSLGSPGVYLWGSNAYGVVDPESTEPIVKRPREFSYFEGQLLRDLKLGEKSGAAITEKGDLVQWGKGFSETDFKPTKTLTGKGLASLCMSQDRIIALASDGSVYSLPISKSEQQSGRKSRETSWVPFWSGTANISYRLLKPALKLGEKVTSLSGGLEHVLLLTNYGRVFSAASSTESFPSRGQLGIPGLTWKTRPKGPADACHEITALKNSKITQVASGDYHSMALSSDGRIFSFGDNSFGQLGTGFDAQSSYKDTPTELLLGRLYRSKEWQTTATLIAAGGLSSFLTVDAKPISGASDSSLQNQARITADTWACGKGITGILGNGRWAHLQDDPTKVKALSGLVEFDERAKKLTPIRLREISVGTTHASAVLDNASSIKATDTSSDSANSPGLDAVWWGGNESFQLGTGKKNNLPKPTYINVPSDLAAKDNKPEARLQITPRHTCKVNGRKVSIEQRVECGKGVSAIYSAL